MKNFQKDSKTRQRELYDFFVSCIKKRKTPMSYAQFWKEQKEIIEQWATKETLKNWCDRWIEKGWMHIVYVRNLPGSLLFSRKLLFPSCLREYDITECFTDYEISEFHQDMYEILRKDTPPYTPAQIAAFGTLPTTEQNLDLLHLMFCKAYLNEKKPFSSDTLAIALGCKAGSEIFEEMVRNIRQAKAWGCFRLVYKKEQTKESNTPYFIPRGQPLPSKTGRTWLTGSERNLYQQQNEKAKMKKKEKEEELQYIGTEEGFFRSLLKREKWELYLFAKLYRLTGLRRNELLLIQRDDYDEETRELIVSYYVEDVLCSSFLKLDNFTNGIMKKWVSQHDMFATDSSLFLSAKRGMTPYTEEMIMRALRLEAKRVHYLLGSTYRECEWRFLTFFCNTDFSRKKILQLEELYHNLAPAFEKWELPSEIHFSSDHSF